MALFNNMVEIIAIAEEQKEEKKKKKKSRWSNLSTFMLWRIPLVAQSQVPQKRIASFAEAKKSSSKRQRVGPLPGS